MYWISDLYVSLYMPIYTSLGAQWNWQDFPQTPVSFSGNLGRVINQEYGHGIEKKYELGKKATVLKKQ